MLIFPNSYCPRSPHPKQELFLGLNCPEAFFGGAAGGGKSIALLMAALQHVDVPGYAALILRRDLPRLALPGGLIPRSHEWLAGTAATWNDTHRQWTFPLTGGPPATLSFGYLSRPYDKFRYASSEFQFIAFDELTELDEDDYLFLFSRLRRIHRLNLPLRVRSASNPGNLGHEWVKQRFVEGAVEANTLPGVLHKEGRSFVPSLIADNPSLDGEEYLRSLMHLPPIERERLARGDWSVREEGMFRRDWLRDYVLVSGQYELLRPGGALLAAIPGEHCRRFATVDPAGASVQSDGPASDARSYSVVQIWDQPRAPELAHLLIFCDQRREQVSVHGLYKLVQAAFCTWKPEKIWIENEKLGHAVAAALAGLPIELVPTRGQSKEVRAAVLANKLERGEIFLPKYDTQWRPAFESELFAWTCDRRQPCDQIDAAAYAAIIAQERSSRHIRLQPVVHRS